MLFKIDKHLSSILIAKGDKPARKLLMSSYQARKNWTRI